MSKALITGIEGFTGRFMARQLSVAGYDVVGLARRKSSDSPVIIVNDLCDTIAVQKAVAGVMPDVVVHLAAVAFVAHGDVQGIYRTNVEGSRSLIAALASCAVSPSAVLLASSANIYGNTSAGVINESEPPAPANDYAVSKIAMEYMAGLWTSRLPITIVRPFNYTGVGQSLDFLLPKIVDHYKRRAPVLELGNLHVERDFSDVRVVVDCYARLLKSDQRLGTFNVCSGQGYTLEDVLGMMSELTGHSPEVRVNPVFVRANEVKKLVGSKAALERAIGPIAPIPLRETLRWMLSSDD